MDNTRKNKIILTLILSIFPIMMYIIASYLFKLANLSLYNQQNNLWWLFSLPHMINILCILILYSNIKQIETKNSVIIISIVYIILLGCPIWALILTSLNLKNYFSFLLMHINYNNMSVILEMFVFYCFIGITTILKRKTTIVDKDL